MNTIHDMGGMHGFGRIEVEPDEPAFHAEWERRVFALVTAVPFAVPFGDDSLRPAIESTPPAEYLASSYYELWLRGVTKLLLEAGAVTPGELATGKAASRPGAATFGRAATRDEIAKAIMTGFSPRRAEGKPPRFKAGDRVRTRNLHPTTHTRLPRYARDKVGTVTQDRGIFSFNDTNGSGQGEQPQHVYAVGFALTELWGPGHPPGDMLYLDLWDDHLDPA